MTSVTRSTSKLYVYVTLQQISDIDSEYDDEDYDLDVYDLSWDDSYGRSCILGRNRICKEISGPFIPRRGQRRFRIHDDKQLL